MGWWFRYLIANREREHFRPEIIVRECAPSKLVQEVSYDPTGEATVRETVWTNGGWLWHLWLGEIMAYSYMAQPFNQFGGGIWWNSPRKWFSECWLVGGEVLFLTIFPSNVIACSKGFLGGVNHQKTPSNHCLLFEWWMWTSLALYFWTCPSKCHWRTGAIQLE